jgi:hypothetical protein
MRNIEKYPISITDEANLPLLRWDLSPLQKLCPQSWKFQPFTSHPLLYLAPLWMPPARILFPFTQGRIHIMFSCLDLLPNGIHTCWNVQPESRVDKCIWNGDKRGDVIETNGKECPSDYTKVGSRAKEMVSIFTIQGPTQLSVQRGLLKPSIMQSECCVEETYLRSRTKHIPSTKWGST